MEKSSCPDAGQEEAARDSPGAAVASPNGGSPKGILKPPSMGRRGATRRLSWCDEQGVDSQPLEKIRYISKVSKPMPWGRFIASFVIMAVFVRVLFTLIDILVLNLSG